MFPESHGFVAMPVKSWIKDKCSNLFISNLWMESKLFHLVIGTATKHCLSGDMLPYIESSKNEWYNFSENLGIEALKLLDLTQFYSLNLSI